MKGAYVDDRIGCENESFKECSLRTVRKFDSKPREELPFSFASISIMKTGMTSDLHQKGYIKKLAVLPPDSSFEIFRPLRHQLACISICSADVVATVNIIPQVPEAKFQ